MFEELLSKIGSCLEKNNLPYMIIGGQAVLLYGEPRLTKDIDVTVGAGIDYLNVLLGAIAEIPLKPIPQNTEKFVKETMVLPSLETKTGIRVDFIFSFTPYELNAINRATKIEIAGKKVSFASLEDLIIHKLFAGRPRDIEDVKSLILKNPAFDTVYVTNWLKEFDKATEDKNLLKTFQDILVSAQTSCPF